MSSRIRTEAIFFLLAIAAGACGGGSGQPEEGASGTTPGDTTTEAPPPLPGESIVTGRITFRGTAPAPRLIRVSSADPLCMVEGGAVRSQVLLVGPQNELQNVFVYVKDGLGDRTFQAPKTPIVLDQEGCVYTPHVFGVQVGQPVEIVNSDPTIHNVHAVPKANDEFNFVQQKQGERDTRVFESSEVMVPFKCDVHGWMAAYAGVLPHPFFAVSSGAGAFEIKGLPQGTYTIEAWHEQLGTQTQTVTVDGKTGATLDFTFEAKS